MAIGGVAALLLVLSVLLATMSLSSYSIFSASTLGSSNRARRSAAATPRVRPVRSRGPVVIGSIGKVGTRRLCSGLIQALASVGACRLGTDVARVIRNRGRALDVIREVNTSSTCRGQVCSSAAKDRVRVVSGLTCFHSGSIRNGGASDQGCSLRSFRRTVRCTSMRLSFSSSPCMGLPAERVGSTIVCLGGNRCCFYISFATDSDVRSCLKCNRDKAIALCFSTSNLFAGYRVIARGDCDRALAFGGVNGRVIIRPPTGTSSCPLTVPCEPSISTGKCTICRRTYGSFGNRCVSFRVSCRCKRNTRERRVVCSGSVRNSVVLSICRNNAISTVF